MKRLFLLGTLLCLLLAGCVKASPDPKPTPTPTVELPGGAQAAVDTLSLDLTGVPAGETEAALALLEQFPDLRELKLGGEGLFTLEQVERLQSEHPEWLLRYTLELAGTETELGAEQRGWRLWRKPMQTERPEPRSGARKRRSRNELAMPGRRLRGRADGISPSALRKR